MSRAPTGKASCFQIHAELAPNHQTTLLRWKQERKERRCLSSSCFIHLCLFQCCLIFDTRHYFYDKRTLTASTFFKGYSWGLADGEMETTHDMLQIQSGSAGPVKAPRAQCRGGGQRGRGYSQGDCPFSYSWMHLLCKPGF